MTAYASFDQSGKQKQIKWEIKSVNHRYLDLFFKMPETLRDLELTLREELRQKIHRGKVECYLSIHDFSEETLGLELNIPLIQQLSDASKKLGNYFENMHLQVSISELLKFPNVILHPENMSDKDKEEITNIFKQALNELLNQRAMEGEKLKAYILEHLSEMLKLFEAIQVRVPQSIKLHREKILHKLKELQQGYHAERFEQEMVFLIQKLDIGEELERLVIHGEAVKQALEKKEPIGRRLDFLMQEMHREVNTMASKAVDTHILQMTTDLKVLIEKIREQVQNIE